MKTAKKVLAAPLIGLIVFYQRVISPMTPTDLSVLPLLLVVRPDLHPALRSLQGNLARPQAVGQVPLVDTGRRRPRTPSPGRPLTVAI